MKIVRGNDFRLKIEVFEAVGTENVVFDLTGAEVEVYVSSSKQVRRRYEHTVEYNTIFVFIDGRKIWLGDYDVEVVVSKNGNLRLKNNGEFSIVDASSEGDVLPGGDIETVRITGVLNVVPVVVSSGEGGGVVFVPALNGVTGMLSWTNNGGLPNPPPVKVKGNTGDPGESAYEAALKGGFTGTEKEFYKAVSSIGNLNSILDIINGE